MRLVTRVLTGTVAAVVLAVAFPGASAVAAEPFPTRIELPDGFAPEGITIGRGTTFYVGSIPTGRIWRGDLRTGAGDVVHVPTGTEAAIGLAVDQRDRVFVAGGGTGRARVVDGRTGAQLASYQLTTGPTFVNDVVVTRTDAWFTDSVNPVLYRVPLDLGAAEVVPITGDLVYQSGFNVNGIDATPDGKTLLLVQSNVGRLFTATLDGVTSRIALAGGESVPNGDGIVLSGGGVLYVVQNRLNLVAAVVLSPDLGSGYVRERIGSADFSVPTTAEVFGDRVYAVNARFGTPVTPTTDYWVTAVERR